MNNKEVFNYLKAVSGFVLIVLFALIIAPPAVDKIIRPLVQSAAVMATGDSNLFGGAAPTIPSSPLAAVQRVLQQRSAQIRREDIPQIVTEIIRAYRPDYDGSTVNAVLEASLPLILSQIPAPLTPDVLTPILGSVIPQAIAALPVGKMPPRYPISPMSLYNIPTFANIGYSAIFAGSLSMIWSILYKPRFPQEEKKRIIVERLILITPAAIILYFAFTYFQMPYSQYFSFRDNGLLLKATAIVVFCYIAVSSIFYFIVALSLAGLPYLADRFWALTPWRSLLPAVTNPLGNLAHALRVVKILMKISAVLRKHFPEEAA